MARLKTWTEVLAAALVTAGCSAEGPTSVVSTQPERVGPEVVVGSHAAVPNVGGLWVFRETIFVLQPSELNGLIGAPPVDTPMTQVTCVSEGTWDIDQDGSSFDGDATQSVECTVNGVTFTPPAFAFNPEFDILNGDIRGRSIHFETGHTLNLCSNRGSIAVRDGQAVGVRAVGDCPVPFHPGEHHSQWIVWRP